MNLKAQMGYGKFNHLNASYINPVCGNKFTKPQSWYKATISHYNNTSALEVPETIQAYNTPNSIISTWDTGNQSENYDQQTNHKGGEKKKKQEYLINICSTNQENCQEFFED